MISVSLPGKDTENENLDESSFPLLLDAPATLFSSSSNSKLHSSDDSDDAGTEGNGDASSNGNVTPEGDELQAQCRRVMFQLESYLTGPHGDEDKMEGRTQAQKPIAWGQIIYALIAEQATLKKHSELPLGPVQDAEPGPTTFAEVCASANVNVWEGAIFL